MKNLSSQQLAAFAAAIIALGFSSTIGFIYHSWYHVGVTFLTTGIASYLLIRYIFEIFVNRKIKLIYKLIYQTKATKREETYFKYILPKKELDEVGEEVVQWAEQRSAEIEQLKTNENYRKEFLQNLSHEIKTPIFAIQGYLELLSDGEIDNPAQRDKFIHQAQANVLRLVQLLNDVDTITNLEISKEPILKHSFIIQDLINEVAQNLSVKGLKKNIQFHFKKGSESPTTVFADKNKISVKAQKFFSLEASAESYIKAIKKIN